MAESIPSRLNQSQSSRTLSEFFDGRVERIEVEDHNPPSMNQIISFVERAGQFVQVNSLHVLPSLHHDAKMLTHLGDI